MKFHAEVTPAQIFPLVSRGACRITTRRFSVWFGDPPTCKRCIEALERLRRARKDLSA